MKLSAMGRNKKAEFFGNGKLRVIYMYMESIKTAKMVEQKK